MENKQIYNDYLMHHGIKGMKWGVRRFQNYDGSYTKTGMKHYRQSEAAYDDSNRRYKSAKTSYKTAKKTGRDVESARESFERAKTEREMAKRQLSKDYDQLKRDKAGDKGKRLYQSGKTITGTNQKIEYATAVIGGGMMVASYLAQNGNMKAAKITGAATGVATAGLAIAAAKGAVEAKYLRAYYSHTRN